MSSTKFKKNKPYDILQNFETIMRESISIELKLLTKKWWKQRVPNDVQKDAKERKDKELKKGIRDKYDLIYYVNFADYAKIIIRRDNWKEVFQNIFRNKNGIDFKLKELEPIRNKIAHTRPLSELDQKKLETHTEDIIGDIRYYKDQKRKRQKISTKDKLKLKSDKTDIGMVVVSDRTVYPTNSKIYVRIYLKKLIFDNTIQIQFLDNKRKILAIQQIDPSTFEYFKFKDRRIYETSFDMYGKPIEVGKPCIISAQYGKAIAEDAFYIDERNPVIQSDKSIYLWGSDMILTVIDPDADKDSRKAEFVGDRIDSKLVISSSKGDIINYRLLETGNSTGIFQGILGFVGVNKDGSVESYKLKNKKITKTQGSQIDDGFLQVGEFEELLITYSNQKEVVKLTAFVLKELKS